jgi:peptide/nickel transport system permease protein
MTAIAVDGTAPRRTRSVLAHDPVLVATTAVIAALVLLALLAPLLTPYSPYEVDILAANQGPSQAHWLGTDSLGRDVLTRLLYGARLSLVGPAVVTLLAVGTGTALALLAAWLGGRIDRLLGRVLDVILAFPALMFGVLAVAVLGTGLIAPVLALSIAYTPYVTRVVRSVAVRERHRGYVEACQLLGYSPWRSVGHVLRNVSVLVIAQATITFGYALIDLAAISFIGLGVQAPAAEWGLMVANGATGILNGSGWEAISAGALIVLTVVSFNVLGERLARTVTQP